MNGNCMRILLRLSVACGLLLAARAAFAEETPPQPRVLKDVVIVYKTHFDIGYTQLARDVAHQYRTEMADGVLDAIEKNSHQPKERQFVWTLSGWPMTQLLSPEQSPPASCETLAGPS